jgi:hypothetical protein
VDVENPIESLLEEFSSAYRVDKFVKSSGYYISPETVHLPPGDDGQARSFQFVPLTELAKAVADQPGFKLPERSHLHQDRSEKILLKDITDGEAYRNNPYFLNNPDALGILLHSDEFESCNPLGPSKGVHKV